MATDVREESVKAGYEVTDVPNRPLLIFFGVTAAGLALISLAMIWVFGHYRTTERGGAFVAQPFENERPVPPSPQIQPDPRADIAHYLSSQQQILNSYGWVDKQNGIVRIPIDRAMELTLQKGLAARPESDDLGKPIDSSKLPTESNGGNPE